MSTPQKNQEDALNFLLVEYLHLRERGGWAWRIGPFLQSTKYREQEKGALWDEVIKLIPPGETAHQGTVNDDDLKNACKELFETQTPQTIKMSIQNGTQLLPFLGLHFQQSFEKEATDAVKALYDKDEGTYWKLPRRPGGLLGLDLFVVSERLVPWQHIPDGASAAERICGPDRTPWGYDTYDKELERMAQEEAGTRPRRPKPSYSNWNRKSLAYEYVGDLAIFVTDDEAEAYVKGLHADKRTEFNTITETEALAKRVPNEISVYEILTPNAGAPETRLVTIHEIHFSMDHRIDITRI
ncbi:uncharacterized protein J4E79_011705 [Alternaria viburni]|uniref:uncharacterized protein n=1 Tax=Alternaria viburni TaxID=566460 RepID=UPI0020C51835|nr:uncharacterized protein J4E79_011705 [Alternaria viburni]KAI4641313.1 hypothetical protein J4E79_011705 [Alternaria viburni]